MSEESLTTALAAQEPIIQITEDGVEGFEILCRICANRSEHLIPIYSEEGQSNDLADKMNLYLPIKVSKMDALPLQCCFQCASTVLTWHELIIACVEADRRLKEVHSEVEKQIAEQNIQPGTSQDVEEQENEEEEEHIDDDNCTTSNNAIIEEKNTDISLKRSVQCSECLKTFFSKPNLERHIRIHRNERPYTCEKCGKSFRDKSAVTRHINHVHIKKKNFSCDICSMKFASAATRDDHHRSHTNEMPFCCQKCGKRFNRKAGLYIHSKTHSDVFPFSCSVCNKKFRRRQELIFHVSTHSGERKFTCDDCGKSFRLKSCLNSHKKVHSDAKPFSCEQCGVSFKQNRYLKRHYVKHKKIKTPDPDNLSPFRQELTPEPDEKRHSKPIKLESSDGWIKTEYVLESDISQFIDCEGDDGDAVKLDPLDIREPSSSESEDFDSEYTPGGKNKIHPCPDCGKNFTKPINLKKHLKKFHLKDETGAKVQIKREYRCDFCQIVLIKKEELRDHIQLEHPDHYSQFTEKKVRKRSKIDQEAVNRAKVVVDSRTYYHCNICGKNLHSPYTYIWHNRIHTGERPFVCDLCGKQFRVSQGLVRHLRETHAGIKNFPCDLCGRMFATRRNVEEHRRIHTNERPYICDLCGKSFKQKASLFVHNRSHTDSFPFKCSYCNQGFRTRPPLLVHVTRHTGEKPYACDICGRCFRIKYELKRHRLIHSDEKPFSCTDCGLSFRQKRYLRNHNRINHNKLTP